jgi:lipopolysaccharide export system protein LptA
MWPPWCGRRYILVLATLLLVSVTSIGMAATADTAEPAAKDQGAVKPTGLFGNFSLGSSHDPIRISADMLEFDYKNQVLTYRGGVEVTQGDIALRSNTLTVHFNEHAPDRDRLREIVADGDVRIGKGTRFATGGHAVFDQSTKTITLSQDAVLHDGPNHVAGDRVVVYLDEGRSVVEGGDQRVHAVLVPPANGEAGGKLVEDLHGDQRPR